MNDIGEPASIKIPLLPEEKENRKLISLNLNLQGMTCVTCANKISSKLESVKGLHQINVCFQTESVSMKIDPQIWTTEQVKKIIEDEGFTAYFSSILIKIYDDNDNEKLQSALKIREGIISFQYQNEKKQLKILFNSGLISELAVLKAIQNSGVRWEKSKGILEEEKEANEKRAKLLKIRLILAIIISIPIVTLSEILMYAHTFDKNKDTIHYVLFALSTLFQILIGSYFYQNSFTALRHCTTNMDVLLSIGSFTAYTYSTYATFSHSHETFQEDSVLIFTFILFGKWLEVLTRGKAASALSKLMEIGSSTARVSRAGKEQRINIAEVDVNDTIVAKPGEKIPLDGKILFGEAQVDESMITGEPLPVRKKTGDVAIGGTIVQNGFLMIRVEKIGNDTMLARIIELVKNVQEKKPRLQRIADSFSGYFIPIVLFIGLWTFAIWWAAVKYSFEDSLLRFITVIVVSCPCSIGLAIPITIMVGSGQGANGGIIFKNGDALERLHNIRHIVFDKTGTLTQGQPELINIVPFNLMKESEILEISASLESASEHSIGKAIIKKANEKELMTRKVISFLNHPGRGIEGIIDNEKYYLGKIDLYQQICSDKSHDILKNIENIQISGRTVSILFTESNVLGILEIMDPIRDYAKPLIDLLKTWNIKVSMLTGDNEVTAGKVANLLGIEQYWGNLLPSHKVNKIVELENQKLGPIAMIGDGINDAPALAKADVGIAMGSGSDIAKTTADVIFLHNDLRNLVGAIILSKKTQRKMIANLIWAVVYNLIAIPFAAGAFQSFLNFFLPPQIASLIMGLSSVSIVLSSLCLKRVDIRNIRERMLDPNFKFT